MPDFELVADFQPTGDQPQAIERLVDGLGEGHEAPGPAGRHGHGQDVHDRHGHRQVQQADAGAGAQQDARRAALQRVPRLLPGQRGRVLRQLLRLLPARGVPAAQRHLHREGFLAQRRDRQAAPRGDAARCSSAATSSSWPACQLHLRPRRPGRLRRDRRAPPRAAVGIAGTACCASSWTSSTSATTRPSPRARFRVRGDTLELQPAYDDFVVRVEFFGDEVERITELDPLTGEMLAERRSSTSTPPRTTSRRPTSSSWRVVDIEEEMEERTAELEAKGHGPRGCAAAPADDVRPRDDARARLLLGHRELLAPPRPSRGRLATLDAARLLPDRLAAGRRREPHDDPQVVGMYKNDRTRKEILVEYGFRLPSRARQPAADLRGVRGPPRPGRLHERDARRL